METLSEDARWFRDALGVLDMRQADFVRFLMRNGDPRPLKTVQNAVGRWWRGEAGLPGELRVLLTLMQRHGWA